MPRLRNNAWRHWSKPFHVKLSTRELRKNVFINTVQNLWRYDVYTFCFIKCSIFPPQWQSVPSAGRA